MLYTLRFFSSKCSLFHNANLFGSCIIHILYTGCAEIKKNTSGAKVLNVWCKKSEEVAEKEWWCDTLVRGLREKLRKEVYEVC